MSRGAEGDLVMVDNGKCQEYNLGNLDDGTYLDVFFQRVDEIEIFHTTYKKDVVKGRCTVHLVDINIHDEEFSPEHVKNSSIYDKLIEQMKRGDIVENINTDDFRSDNVLFFNGKNIIDRGKTIDKHGNIPEEFDMINEFNPGYWDLNGSDNYNGENKPYNINDELVDENVESTFYWNTDNYAFGYIDLSKIDCKKISKDYLGIKHFLFTHNKNEYMVIYTDDNVKSNNKIAVKNVERYDCTELYKNFRNQMSENLTKFQDMIRCINNCIDYVLIAK